ASAGALADDKPIKEGHRDDTLFRMGCALRGLGATEAGIYKALLAINEECCSPPLPDAQVAQKARSAARYAPGDPFNDLDDLPAVEPRPEAEPAPSNAVTPKVFAGIPVVRPAGKRLAELLEPDADADPPAAEVTP